MMISWIHEAKNVQWLAEVQVRRRMELRRTTRECHGMAWFESGSDNDCPHIPTISFVCFLYLFTPRTSVPVVVYLYL